MKTQLPSKYPWKSSRAARIPGWEPLVWIIGCEVQSNG